MDNKEIALSLTLKAMEDKDFTFDFSSGKTYDERLVLMGQQTAALYNSILENITTEK